MTLFDTHCHIDMLAGDELFFRELSNAKASGVKKLLIPSCGMFNWNKVESIASQNKGVYFSLGLHPCYMKEHHVSHLMLLDEKLSLKENQCVAIGECGLDFFLSRDNEALQKTFFIEQVRLANQYHLPLILHSRKAHQDIITLLKQNKVQYGGVVHAFTGSFQQAMEYINLGFHIGVGGTITYPRAKKTRETISRLPLSSLVLETDSPDMPLWGHQGKKNRPQNLNIILNALNKLRNESEQMIVDQIYKNSHVLYAICDE